MEKIEIEKSFDAVKMMRDIRDKINVETVVFDTTILNYKKQ